MEECVERVVKSPEACEGCGVDKRVGEQLEGGREGVSGATTTSGGVSQ